MSSGDPGLDPWLGKTIEGRYVLRRRIGRGGMGVVYEAEHAALDRRVAIKLILAKEAPEDYLTRFRREARLASRITHEHLVHIYDVGIDPETGADYIVMEYVEGRDLARELDGGPLAFSRTIAIARQLLQGLQAIHEGEIIHRDIKPSNVMLTTRSGEPDFVKLMDFGIARAIGDASLTVTGHVVGTPSFMSPEQLRGLDVDHRSDLYAVGITLFAMIAGKLPFEGNTALLAGQHVFQPPPSLAKLRPETPRALVAAVERALAKAPADRFPDALAFANALDAAPAAASRPPPVVTPSVATLVERPRPKRHARWPLIVGGVALVGVAAAILWALQRPATPAATTTIATPSAPPVRVDAAVPVVDAAITAAAGTDATTTAITDAATTAIEPSAGPDLPIAPPPGTGPEKRPRPPATGPPQLCHCIPTSAPDIIGLCPTKGTSLCRCDTASGASLCPVPLKPCGPLEGIDCARDGVVCADRLFTTYHLAGRVDEPCSGFGVPRYGLPDPDRVPGHLECDVCAGARLDTFKGHDGDACSGYYWRTGEAKTGKLAHCQ